MRRTRLRKAGKRLGGVCRRFVLPAVAILTSLVCAAASAAPLQLEFLEGLRSRRYDDIALYYIDQLEADPQTPPDVKEVLDYERAATLIRMAKQGADPSTQAKQLDEATAALEKFIAAHPDHALVAKAQTERGEILIGKARVAILQAEAPGNEGTSETYRQEGRAEIVKAREIFEAARKEYEEQWKAFGPFVDADAQETRAARDAALNALIQSRLHLAECTYREARTYAIGQPKRNELLTKAAAEYEAIHADYRSQIGGLFARLWMAKCFEEQAPRPEKGAELAEKAKAEARQRLNIAEAIYSELLDHDTRGSRSAAQMQDYAFWFKLIVRNHPALADYQLVVDQASEWLKTRNGSAAQTIAALGVRWERAQAYDHLANRRDVPEGDRNRFLQSALADAEFVNTYPGEYRDVSRAMIQRLKALLGRGEGDPQDFDAADGLAQSLHNQIGAKQEAVKAAKTPEEKTAAAQALAAHLDETARILHLALGFAGPSTETPTLNKTRYQLAYVEYSRNRPHDAAVLGDFVSRKFVDESPQLALDSAYLAMAAYYKLYDAVPEGGSNEFELTRLKDTATFIATSFPESEQANEARMMVGRLFLQGRDFAQAAEWFAKVPASSPQAMEARLLAGRSFWDAYAVAAAVLNEDDDAARKAADALKAQAETFLREGLAMADKQIPQDAVPPENVVTAKLSLAQIANLDGKYQEAVDLLVGGKQPISKLVAVEAGKPRPKTGITSAAFASLTHQQILRSYIGLQQMEPAIAEMKMLEQIGGEGNTAVFVQLGQQIKNELENQPAGPRRDAVMTAFDQFLGKLATMTQGQTYGSLLWISETYYGLAQAAAEPKSSEYFDRSSENYEAILARADEQGFLPSADAVHGVRLRLASVEKSRGEYAKAYDLARQVLKSAPTALNAQVAAAEILQEWGGSGQADAPEKLLLSIQGDPSVAAVPVWGWGQIAQRLQRTIWGGNATDEFKELYRKARYEIPAARRAYANLQNNKDTFNSEISKAEKELTAYVATTPKSEIGDVWWEKLNALYADIQRDQGAVVIKKLEPATSYESRPEDEPAETVAAAASETNGATPAVAKPSADDESGSGLLPILVGVLLAAGLTGGVVFMMRRGNKTQGRRLSYGTVGAAADSISIGDVPSFDNVDRGTATRVRGAGAAPKIVTADAGAAASRQASRKSATRLSKSKGPAVLNENTNDAAERPRTRKIPSTSAPAVEPKTVKPVSARPAAATADPAPTGAAPATAPKPVPKPTPKPADKRPAKPAASEQPLVVKKVRRTKPAE